MKLELKSVGMPDFGVAIPAERGASYAPRGPDHATVRRNGSSTGVQHPAAGRNSTLAWESAPAVLVGEREHRLYVLMPEKVEYIQSEGNYVKLHGGGAEFISRDSVKRLAALLEGRGFVRIERSLLLNIRAILYAQRTGRGTFLFTLSSGACLRSGQAYRAEILRVLPLA